MGEPKKILRRIYIDIDDDDKSLFEALLDDPRVRQLGKEKDGGVEIVRIFMGKFGEKLPRTNPGHDFLAQHPLAPAVKPSPEEPAQREPAAPPVGVFLGESTLVAESAAVSQNINYKRIIEEAGLTYQAITSDGGCFLRSFAFGLTGKDTDENMEAMYRILIRTLENPHNQKLLAYDAAIIDYDKDDGVKTFRTQNKWIPPDASSVVLPWQRAALIRQKLEAGLLHWACTYEVMVCSLIFGFSDAVFNQTQLGAHASRPQKFTPAIHYAHFRLVEAKGNVRRETHERLRALSTEARPAFFLNQWSNPDGKGGRKGNHYDVSCMLWLSSFPKLTIRRLVTTMHLRRDFNLRPSGCQNFPEAFFWSRTTRSRLTTRTTRHCIEIQQNRSFLEKSSNSGSQHIKNGLKEPISHLLPEKKRFPLTNFTD